MAQKQLNIPIVLQGRVDNSVTKLGSQLTSLGSQIDEIGSSIRQLGMESLTEFMGYDDIMRVVDHIGGYSSDTMKALDEYNKTISQTSRYTKEQAANAELLMARLGIGLDDIKTMMPTVMDTATAANISLSDSLDYLYYSLQALDQPMSYATVLSDQMAKAADISAADIDGLGQSLQRLGSGAQFFAGGSSEILAILAGISRFGKDMQGYEAGTRLRNFMLTMVAPTVSKQSILDSFGIGEAEWDDFEAYMADSQIDLTETAAAMNEMGLSAYDSATGKLKPAIQIIAELDAALKSLNSDSERNKATQRLFGLRTSTTALNLIEALDEIIAYEQAVANGSEGYTQKLADAVDGGLGGAIRELDAAWSDLKVTFGESIAPEAEMVADFLANAASSLSNIDPVIMEGLTTGLGTIAAAGSGLMLAGGAMHALALALSPAGIGVMSVATVLGVASALAELDAVNFEDGFGIMELDTAALDAHLNTIEQSFRESYAEINTFEGALETAIAGYQEASTALSSQLLTTAITGAKLTEEDITSLQSLGTTMGNRLLDGVNASFDESMAYLSLLGGDSEQAQFSDAFILGNQLREKMLQDAKTLGEEFGETLGTAMDDGIITGDEYAVILEKLKAYNEAMALQTGADRAGEQALLLNRAASLSLDSAKDTIDEYKASYDESRLREEEEYIRQRARMEYLYNEGIRQGLATEEQKNGLLTAMDAAYKDRIGALEASYSDSVVNLLMGMTSGGEYIGAWPLMEQAFGDLAPGTDLFDYLTNGQVNWKELDDAGKLNQDGITALYRIGTDAGKIIDLFDGFEDVEGVAELFDWLDLATLLADDATKYIRRKKEFEESGYTLDPYNEWVTDEQLVRNARRNELSYEIGDLQNQLTALDEKIAVAEDHLAGKNLPKNYAMTKGKAKDQTFLHGSDTGYAQREALASELEALLAEQEELGGFELGAFGLEESVQQGAADSQEWLNSNHGEWQVDATIHGLPGGAAGAGTTLDAYAQGGRATEASIFGEAGAEWAIPEEHTANTANLLLRAAEASGFTWHDIGQAAGGSKSSAASTTLVYAPTIVANDATGVAEKLREDKERFERWLRDRELKDSVAVYA